MWKREKMIHGKMIYSLLFLPLLAFFSLFWHSNTYAVADYSRTLTNSDYSAGYDIGLCGRNNPDNINCSDYSYIIFTPSWDWSTLSGYDRVKPSFVFHFETVNFSNYKTYYYSFFSPNYLPIDSSLFSSFVFSASYSSSLSSVLGSNWSLTITLTNTPPISCPSSPSGSLTITENGTFDVSSYSEAVVDVPPEIIYPTYHDDLVNIKNVILLVPAVLLLIYFFYCIYRIIIVNTRR